MQENFLYYIWKNRLFDSASLITTRGERLEILDTGKQNSNSGPDFLNEKLKLETLYGQVTLKSIKNHLTG